MILVPNSSVQFTEEETARVQVFKVCDGDGFLASLHHPVDQSKQRELAFRFAFIDAPETDQFFGAQSTAFLSNLILNKTLALVPIFKESNPTIPLDSYRRVLCMGFLEEEMPSGQIAYYWNGKLGVGRVGRPRSVMRNIELEMIVNGFAWVLPQYSFEWSEEYLTAQDDARRHRRGLWATNNPEPPWKFKARKKRQALSTQAQIPMI